MLKAHNISFYKLMTAGYLSAETYCALKPLRITQLHELAPTGYKLFDGTCRDELRMIFEDELTQCNIAYLEQIEKDIFNGNTSSLKLLDNCLKCFDNNTIDIVNQIGRKAFLLEYVFCKESTLSSRLFVNQNNIVRLKELIKSFKQAYHLFCKGVIILNSSTSLKNNIDTSHSSNLINNIAYETIESKNNVVNESCASYQSTTRKENDPCSSETLVIHPNAISTRHNENKKYVTFIYSLKGEQLDPIVKYCKLLLEDIPIRVSNCIRCIGYKNFLVNYLFADDAKLMTIRNFGKKSIHDFNEIKPKIINYISVLYEQQACSHNNPEIDHNDLELNNQPERKTNSTLLDSLGIDSYILIEKKFNQLKKKLSIRSQNAISNYRGDFIEEFVNRNKDVKEIHNIGRKSIPEITSLIEEIKQSILLIQGYHVIPDDLRIIDIQTAYGIYFDEYAQSFLKEKGHLPLLFMLNHFCQDLIQNNKDFQIYNLFSPIFQDEIHHNFQEIGIALNYTRENVRQKYNRTYNKLHNSSFNSIIINDVCLKSFFEHKTSWQYVKDQTTSMEFVGQSEISMLFSDEQHQFTSDIVLWILKNICEDEYSLIGKDPLQYPLHMQQGWDSCFLVKSKYIKYFDFNRIQTIISNFQKSSVTDIVASAPELLLGLLLEAWIDFNSNMIEDVSHILSLILIRELNIIPDSNLRFTIKGLKKENATDIIYSTLFSNGSPISINDLLKTVNLQHNNQFKSIASLRAQIKRDPRMCFIGVKQQVGLLEWDYIKIGSIRDIIIQYLSMFDEPKPLSQIVAYIKEYRDTSENSIRSTMSSGEQFVQFPDGLYGLTGKEYPREYYLSEFDRQFDQRIQELENFLKTNKRFPFGSTDATEDALYRWWKKIAGYTTLTEHQKAEVNRISFTYNSYAKSRREKEWFNYCSEYSIFIKENHGRRPSPSIESEKSLYYWFYRAQEDFPDGKLSASQELAFIELCKSL